MNIRITPTNAATRDHKLDLCALMYGRWCAASRAVEDRVNPFHPDHERLEQDATTMEAVFASEGFIHDEVVERYMKHEAAMIAFFDGDALAMEQPQPTALSPAEQRS